MTEQELVSALERIGGWLVVTNALRLDTDVLDSWMSQELRRSDIEVLHRALRRASDGRVLPSSCHRRIDVVGVGVTQRAVPHVHGAGCGVGQVSTSVQHRCPRMREHARPEDSCACHPHLPIPCPECFSVRVTSESIPYRPQRAVDEHMTMTVEECKSRGGHCYERTGLVLTTYPPQHPEKCKHCPASRVAVARGAWTYHDTTPEDTP